MKTIMISIACVLGALGTQAQETRSTDTAQSVQKKETEYAYLVKTADGKGSVVKRLIIDSHNKEPSKNWDITREFGSPDQRKIIEEVNVKPSVDLLDRDQLLAHYHIPREQRSLPLIIYWGMETVSTPGERLLADLSIVDSVCVKDNGAHIAVYTRYHLNHPSMVPKLSDLQVRLGSTAFEKVGSRPVWIEEEYQQRPNPQFTFDIGRWQVGHYLPERDRTINSETNQIYRFKETGELIFVTSKYGRRYKERDWDEIVEDRVSGHCWWAGGKENCVVEHLEEKTYRAVILFVKENKRRSANYIMYKSLEEDAFLEIIYLSDLPSEERLENMRKILKGLKMGE